MLRKTPFELLKAIKDNQESRLKPSFGKTCMKVCRRCYGSNLLIRFVSIGLVKRRKCGRKLVLRLTAKGEEALESLEVIDKGLMCSPTIPLEIDSSRFSGGFPQNHGIIPQTFKNHDGQGE